MIPLVILGLVVVGLVVAVAWRARQGRASFDSAASDPREVPQRHDDRSGLGPF